MKKKLTISLIVVAVLVVAISITAVIAYMFRQTSEIENVFVPAEVDCTVKEEFNGNLKTSVTVKNESNIDAYIRLRVVTYWKDSKGNIVARNSALINIEDALKYDSDNWIYDESEKTFYYIHPVSPEGKTAELLKLQSGYAGISFAPVTEIYDGVVYTYHPVVTFVAEAIQSLPGGANSPVTEKWNVTIDSSGIITGLNK